MIDTLMPYIVGFFGVAVVGVIVGLLYYGFKPESKEIDYTEQLKELIGDDEEEDLLKKDSLLDKWNKYWNKLLSRSDIARYNDNDNHAGRDMIILAIVITLVGTLLGNIILGLLLAGGALYGIGMIINASGQRKSKELDEQLPGLLFSLKSNLQAGDTNERAMMSVVDAMPSPLYDDLLIGKNILLANGTFKEALKEMSANTSSRDLKFLCSCMIQASDSGSNMTVQLDNIQKVLEERRKVASEIDTSVKAVAPALWLAAFIIPIMFGVSYFMDSSAQDFWFKTPLAWVGFFGVVALYLIGLLMTKSQVDKVRNI